MGLWGKLRCLRRLVDSAKAEFKASARRTSPALYTVDDAGKVVPLLLPLEHPLAGDVALGHALMAMSEYEPQQELLAKQLGDSVFVASYKAIQRPDGSVFSYAVWSRGSHSLLPRADQVALVFQPGEEKGEVLRVPWSAMMDIAGDCFAEEPDLDPPRWRTKDWPDDGKLAQLRRAAVS